MGSSNSFIIICAFLCYNCRITMANDSNASETDDLPVAQPFVDILISDYFRMEQMLWRRLENRADNILLQVYKNHEMFFDRAISQSGSGILGANLIPGIEQLQTIVGNINGTAELGQTHLKEQTLDRQSITEYATTGLKILKDASNLFEYAMKDTMWEKIISVSCSVAIW